VNKLSDIKGKAIVLNMNNVSTDQIFPGQYVNLTDPNEIAEHVLEGADKSFKNRIKTGDILVAGNNFGCGSSREQAVITLKEAGFAAVIANSVGRIWYRNAINLGLPVLICEGFVNQVEEGDEIEVNLKEGIAKNSSKGTIAKGNAISDFVLNIFANGGIKPMMKSKILSK